jgi:hypothetical protein
MKSEQLTVTFREKKLKRHLFLPEPQKTGFYLLPSLRTVRMRPPGAVQGCRTASSLRSSQGRIALSDNFGEMASRRDASPGRTALHSVRIASFGELARPFCSASINHGRDAFRRNATGGGQAFFYRATHPSGMQLCRGFFVGLSFGRNEAIQNPFRQSYH